MSLPELTIPGLTEEQNYVLTYNIKSYNQYKSMRETFMNGECPFCTINTDLNEIAFENDSWKVWPSPFPHKHTQLHLVIAYTHHTADPLRFTKEDYVNLYYVNDFIFNTYDIPGGLFCGRLRDVRYNTASVPSHFHWNIQIPDGSGPVNAPVHKTKEEMEIQKQRAWIYEKIYLYKDYSFESEDSCYNSLSGGEKALISGRYPILTLE